MERHVPHRFALALLAAGTPVPVLAESLSDLADVHAFDLAVIPDQIVTGRQPHSVLRSQALGQVAVREREKIKLRLRYQTGGNGPRFEIGTIGSRKGAMKSRLFHVAMDLFF